MEPPVLGTGLQRKEVANALAEDFLRLDSRTLPLLDLEPEIEEGEGWKGWWLATPFLISCGG